MHLVRGHQTDPAMVMLLVVPVEEVLLQSLAVGRSSSVRGKHLTSQAATSNSTATNSAWALMS
jgi:hypothetical protein